MSAAAGRDGVAVDADEHWRTSGDATGGGTRGMRMIVAPDLPAAVGNTPLIRLRRASEATGCEIWGKAEFMNPGQSVKDRAALWIIRDAVARGALRPGGTIVEGTAGNTGIGLALIGAAMGFRTVIVIPDTQSQEKKDMIRAARAPSSSRCRRCPTATRTTTCAIPGRLAEALAGDRPERRGLGQPVRQRREPPGARREHRAGDLGADRRAGSTASSARSAPGGTLAGVAEGLRARKPGGRGSASPIRTARRSGTTTPTASLKAEGSSITEGIGQGRITANLEGLERRHALPHPRRRGGADRLRPPARGGALHGRLDRDQRRRRDPHGARPRAGAHASSPCSATTARAISRSSSTPAFLRAKGLPVPDWLERARATTSPMPGRS